MDECLLKKTDNGCTLLVDAVRMRDFFTVNSLLRKGATETIFVRGCSKDSLLCTLPVDSDFIDYMLSSGDDIRNEIDVSLENYISEKANSCPISRKSNLIGFDCTNKPLSAKMKQGDCVYFNNAVSVIVSVLNDSQLKVLTLVCKTDDYDEATIHFSDQSCSLQRGDSKIRNNPIDVDPESIPGKYLYEDFVISPNFFNCRGIDLLNYMDGSKSLSSEAKGFDFAYNKFLEIQI